MVKCIVELMTIVIITHNQFWFTVNIGLDTCNSYFYEKNVLFSFLCYYIYIHVIYRFILLLSICIQSINIVLKDETEYYYKIVILLVMIDYC